MEPYTFSSPQRQAYSLPNFMIKYFSQNWSSTVYQKLTLTCKHFYGTHQILCVPDISVINSNALIWRSDTRISNWIFQDNQYIFNKTKTIDLEVNKVWITGELRVEDKNEAFQDFCHMIYKSTITSLTIFRNHINFDDFKKLTPEIEYLDLSYTVVQDEKGEDVRFGDIMATVPHVADLRVWNTSEDDIDLRQCSSLSLPYLPKLKEFSIGYAEINIDDYCKFIENHPGRKFNFTIISSNLYNSLKSSLKAKYSRGETKLIKDDSQSIWSFTFDDTTVTLIFPNSS